MYIKNMIGRQAESSIRSLFERMGLHPYVFSDGEFEIPGEMNAGTMRILRLLLRKEKYEVLFDRTKIQAEKVSRLIIDMIHHSRELPIINYSEYISRALCVNYTSLSKSFSKSMGVTIEQFIITQRIERVKKLLSQQELTLAEIASILHYSSAAHLSAQFKRVTGLAPSIFRKAIPTEISKQVHS